MQVIENQNRIVCNQAFNEDEYSQGDCPPVSTCCRSIRMLGKSQKSQITKITKITKITFYKKTQRYKVAEFFIFRLCFFVSPCFYRLIFHSFPPLPFGEGSGERLFFFTSAPSVYSSSRDESVPGTSVRVGSYSRRCTLPVPA